MKTKPTAEEFLKSKGYDVRVSIFKGLVDLLEEYAILHPYDPEIPRFPSNDEMNEMAKKYNFGPNLNMEPGFYAGVYWVKTWLDDRGL